MAATAGNPKDGKAAAIVEAAAFAFALAGYQRTQMADIAVRAGVALGTLYRYAESKEELFACTLALGVGRDPASVRAHRPIRDVEDYFAKRLPEWFSWSSGGAIEAQFLEDGAPVGFNRMVAIFYDTLAAHRLAIRILDRSAHDLPRLNEIYVKHVREPAMQVLVRCLSEQVARGEIQAPENIPASARFVLESCAWFAMHRQFSPGGSDIPDDLARRTVLAHLSAAFQRG